MRQAKGLTDPRAELGRLHRPAEPRRGRNIGCANEGKRRMSQQEQNIELIKKGYEAFAAGDVETLMSLLDDNVEWVQPGESAISGTYHGKGEFAELLRRMGEKSLTAKLNRLLADGDTVIGLTEVTAGDERSQDADVFTLRDGKITRAQLYTDTAVMERVFGKKQVATG